MKNIGTIICISTLFLLSGCKDFLDRYPTDTMESELVWQSDDYAQRAVNGIYRIANGEYALQGYGMRFSSWGPDGFNYFYSNTMETGIATPTDGFFLNFYTGWYNMIRASNEVIFNLDDNEFITADLRTRLIGEAKFFRGMGHFLLWHFFGDVVIRDKPLTPTETNLPKNDAAEVLAFARKDFEDAVAALPVAYGQNEWGKITKGAAIAMLGKSYLYNEQWQEAADQFALLLTNPFDYDLHPVYAELFDWKHEVNKEVIYSLQFEGQTDYGSAYDVWYGTRSNNSYGGAECVASYATLSNYQRKNGTFIDFSTRPVRADYNNEEDYGIVLMAWYENLLQQDIDERLSANIILPTSLFRGRSNAMYKLYWPYNAYADRTEEPLALRLEFSSYATLPWRKLVNEGTDNTQGSPTDFPLIRFADILLLYAEALNEASGPQEEAFAAIDRVRERAGMPKVSRSLSKNQLQREIRLERLRELPGEGHLYLDVRRWRIANSSNDTFLGLNRVELDFRGEKLFDRVYPEKYDHWPIPFADLEINKELTQNPDWVE